MERASGGGKKREAVIGLTPSSFATSVRRILPGLVRFRAMPRSYHRSPRGQRTIDSATKPPLSNRLPKPRKLRTISVEPKGFAGPRSHNKKRSGPAISDIAGHMSGGHWMSSVQIRDVRKSFGSFEVLHGVSI